MRILSLGLDRFGPFTGRTLAFRGDARLHVVYGRNEAGKSSSLAAVTDLLFGIERSTAWDFQHAGKDLLLQATVADRAGVTLTFQRRKNRPVLSAPDGAVLPDDVLAPFLGGITRDVFRRAFGLDAEALRRSAEELQKSDGELGAALLSAGSGLRGFTALRKELDAEADTIFAPRSGKDRRFYQAAERFEQARKQLRETETRAGALKSLRDEIAACEDDIARASIRRSEIAVDRARIERLRRAAPIIAAIDDVQARLAGLSGLPDAPEGSGGRLAKSLEALDAARSARDQAAQREQKLARDRDALHLDGSVIEHADEIERLAEEAGAFLKAQQDLPRVQADTDAAIAALDQLARRLGLADADAVIARRPDDAAQAKVEELLSRGVALEARARSATEALERHAEQLAARRREREDRGALADPAPLRERLAALRPALRRIAQARGDLALLAGEDAELALRAARLVPPVQDLEALARAPLPARETVLRFGQRLAALEENMRREAAALEAAGLEVARTEATLASLSAGRPVPTPEAIAAARAARGQAWGRLRPVLFGEGDALSPAALAAAVADFETRMVGADVLADAAVDDAARVESHAAETRRLADRRATALAASVRLDEVTASLLALEAEWTAAWRPAGVEPLPPGEMASWLERLAGLIEAREGHARRRVQIEAALAEEERLQPHLAALSGELALAPLAGLDAETLGGRIETEIERMARRWGDARELDGAIAGLAKQVETGTAENEAATSALASWQAAFAASLPAIGLPESAGAREAAAALKAWQELPGVLRERNDLQRRVAGIRRDTSEFEKAVGALRAVLGPAERGETADVAIRRLVQRLKGARDTHARLGQIDEALADAREELEGADATLAAARSAAAALGAGLGCEDPDAFAETARNLTRRDALAEMLRGRRLELANAADGRDEASLREALAGHDPDPADAELALFKREEDTLDAAIRQASAAKALAEQRLAAIQGSVGAETALIQRRGAEAEMVEAARDWAVVKLAALMVGAAVERRRSAQHGPMLARTGALFATLTGGSYTGIAQRYDDHDAPHLVGCRASGEEKPVAAMSEGARDQLCLALRLAYLEDFAARAEPAPFIGDDLFSSFDEERTAHGLAALAAIGGNVQPILFTHHRFVADTAVRELGTAVDVIEL